MKSFKLKTLALAVVLGTAVAGAASAETADSLTTFTAGTTAVAADVNANFSTLATAIDDNAAAIDANSASIEAKQDRVTGTCDSDSAIGAINADGSVNCATFPTMPLPQTLLKSELQTRTYNTTLTGAPVACSTDDITVDYPTVAVLNANFDNMATSATTLNIYLVRSADGGSTWQLTGNLSGLVALGHRAKATSAANAWASRSLASRSALTAGTYRFGIQAVTDSGEVTTTVACNLLATIF